MPSSSANTTLQSSINVICLNYNKVNSLCDTSTVCLLKSLSVCLKWLNDLYLCFSLVSIWLVCPALFASRNVFILLLLIVVNLAHIQSTLPVIYPHWIIAIHIYLNINILHCWFPVVDLQSLFCVLFFPRSFYACTLPQYKTITDTTSCLHFQRNNLVLHPFLFARLWNRYRITHRTLFGKNWECIAATKAGTCFHYVLCSLSFAGE